MPPPPPPVGEPVGLVFKVQPADGLIEARLSPIEVAVVDSAGTVVSLDDLPITLLLSIDSVGATLSGTKTARTQDGIAVFNDLSLDRAGWGFRLAANPPLPAYSGRISSGTSNPFQVLYPPGTHLAFRTQPAQAMAAVPLAPIEIAIRDSAEHDLTRVVTLVSVALTGPPDMLQGALTAPTVGGTARFTDLAVSGAATGVSLRASAFGLPSILSNSFNVAPHTGFKGSSVAAGGLSSCALDNDGAAWCWGQNFVGQLGDGREVSIPRPNPVAGGLTFSQISLAKQTSHGEVSEPELSVACGTSTAGTVYCWGGGLQPLNGIDASTPKPLGGSGGFRTVNVGRSHACALANDGAVECWGNSPIGPRGGRVAGDRPFTQVSEGERHTCALASDGAAFCWGAETRGLLGNGTEDASATPVRVAGEHIFQTITAGDNHTCGIDRDGVAWCWGWRFIPLGDGIAGTSMALEPVRVTAAQRFTAISAGSQHTCALAAGGQAWCWGNGWSGQIGDGTTTIRPQPVAIGAGLSFTAISAGGRHTCAITSSGDAWCWGDNRHGQLGSGNWRESHMPVPVFGHEQFVAISAGGDATCGITRAGTGLCWGDNSNGELGDGRPLIRPVPGRVLKGLRFTSISAGGQGVCALNSAHETWCWGYVGDSVEKRSTPLRLTADPGFRIISVGARHSCGIDADGAGWCWGDPTLGNGSRDTSAVPVRISGGLKLADISVGYHTCALTVENDVFCWGPRVAAPGTDFSVPKLVPGGMKFVALGGGGSHDCALTAAGEAYCWGDNTYGVLGDGSRTHSPTPQRVVGGLHFARITAGFGLTCGITADQQAYCWRFDPNNMGWARPTLVPGNIQFVSIAVSRTNWHACGVATTGAVYCWGMNEYGQLGNGTTSSFYAEMPQLVIGLSQ